jgi:hypothetical protein
MERKEVVLALLQHAARSSGREVVHLFDRCYASAPWLGHFFAVQVRFPVRWHNSFHLQDGAGRRLGRPAQSRTDSRACKSTATALPTDIRLSTRTRTGRGLRYLRFGRYPETHWWVYADLTSISLVDTH